MNHCCELMNLFLNDSRIPINYNAIFRYYYLPVKGASAIQCLLFCPWCGNKLPKELNEEYYAIFYDELNLKEAKNLLDTPGLPEEFKSDEWWKKRGL